MPGNLMMWVVYDKVEPYPRNTTAREVEITADGIEPTGNHAVGPLAVVRGYLSEELGLTCLPRSPDDDPSIVETWV